MSKIKKENFKEWQWTNQKWSIVSNCCIWMFCLEYCKNIVYFHPHFHIQYIFMFVHVSSHFHFWSRFMTRKNTFHFRFLSTVLLHDEEDCIVFFYMEISRWKSHKKCRTKMIYKLLREKQVLCSSCFAHFVLRFLLGEV